MKENSVIFDNENGQAYKNRENIMISKAADKMLSRKEHYYDNDLMHGENVLDYIMKNFNIEVFVTYYDYHCLTKYVAVNSPSGITFDLEGNLIVGGKRIFAIEAI